MCNLVHNHRFKNVNNCFHQVISRIWQLQRDFGRGQRVLFIFVCIEIMPVSHKRKVQLKGHKHALCVITCVPRHETFQPNLTTHNNNPDLLKEILESFQVTGQLIGSPVGMWENQRKEDQFPDVPKNCLEIWHDGNLPTSSFGCYYV